MDNKIKILVVDDDPKVPWIISEGLGKEYNVDSVRDGSEAISYLSQISPSVKPDLILLDIKMPGQSGLDVLEKLKKVDSSLDIMMLSGHRFRKNCFGMCNRYVCLSDRDIALLWILPTTHRIREP